MPNWCMNNLEVAGDVSELKRFVEANMGLPAEYPPKHKGKEPVENSNTPYFCFNALVPTPKDVLEIGFARKEQIPEINVMYAYRGETVFPLDGYHWNIANWGTKWDVYDDAITAEEMGWHEGAERIAFEFDTAWKPPLAWLKKAAMLFPALRFKLHYEEPSNFFAGDLYAEGLNAVLDPYDDARCREAFNYMFDGEDNEQESEII